jgi:pyruvate-formate lyase-activating enzyme
MLHDPQSPAEYPQTPTGHTADCISPRYQRYLDFVRRQRKLALDGALKLAPDGLWLSITENCNFRCVGCYTEGLFKKTYVSIDEVRRMLPASETKFTYISLTEGEAFLHPQLCEIIELCKATHPESVIDLVTNASIPIRGRSRRAVSLIDSLGVSIDGATKETYESIRKGGNFERFLANTKEIVAVRADCGNPKDLEFSFTAMSTNIAELVGVVEIAAEIGVPNVYFQPMEIRDPEIVARVGAFNLSRMAVEDVYRITDEAIATGKALGVAVYGAPSMVRQSGPVMGADDPIEVESRRDEAVCTCQFFWSKPFQYVRDGERYQVLPCCYMLKSDALKISHRYGLHYEKPEDVLKVYNSPGYWRMRQDLAAGALHEFCGGCMQAMTHPWKEAP